MLFLLPLEYFGKLFFGGRFVLYEISLRLKSGEHFVLRIIGIWFAVQHIVVVRDMPVVAAGIIKESDLSIDDCKAAQKRSGSFDKQMRKFIKTELE